MDWPTPFVVLVDVRQGPTPVPMLGGPCDLVRRGEELLEQLHSARLTENSEVMLVIERADMHGDRLPTLWAELPPDARGAAEQRRRTGEASETQLREALVRGVALGLDGWLSFCRRPSFTFPDLPYTCCQILAVTLEIHQFES